MKLAIYLESMFNLCYFHQKWKIIKYNCYNQYPKGLIIQMKNSVSQFSPERQERVLFVGATQNFFKVGYSAMQYLNANYSDKIKLRLVHPFIEDVKYACKGVEIELVRWYPSHPESLEKGA